MKIFIEQVWQKRGGLMIPMYKTCVVNPNEDNPGGEEDVKTFHTPKEVLEEVKNLLPKITRLHPNI